MNRGVFLVCSVCRSAQSNAASGQQLQVLEGSGRAEAAEPAAAGVTAPGRAERETPASLPPALEPCSCPGVSCLLSLITNDANRVS